MERGRDGRNDPFGAGGPFAGFGTGFGPLGTSMPSLFGGRDPFDDPFFTQPFGGRMGGPGMFGHGLFGPMGGPGMFGAFPAGDGFLEQAPPRSNSGGRPVITEIDDDEEEDGERGSDLAHRHESYVQEPDDGNDGMQGGQVQLRRDTNRANGGQPQLRTFTHQSSSVTYGGINGAYYTASKTRRSCSDGITVEESKEADTTTREATHRISRGIHDKGHSLTKKLKADGKVDSTQILHNLNEDELPVFEESWRGNAGQHLPGWNQNAGTSNGANSVVGSPQGTLEPMVCHMHRAGRSPELSNSRIQGGGTAGGQNHRESSQSLEGRSKRRRDGLVRIQRFICNLLKRFMPCIRGVDE